MSSNALDALGSDGRRYRIVAVAHNPDVHTLAAPSSAVGASHYALEDGRALKRIDQYNFALLDGSLNLQLQD